MHTLLTKSLIFILPAFLFASGGYDHGTSAGKGNMDISLTWNPFGLFRQGQSYLVFGYGITDKLDLHGYYSSSPEKNDNYYLGIYFQFLNSTYLHLATAVGLRQYTQTNQKHLFLPQLLYSIQLPRDYSIGGSMVNIKEKEKRKKGLVPSYKLTGLGTTLDVALFIPIKRKNPKDRIIQEVKLGVGAFKPVLWTPKWGDWYPTYSLDVKFSLPRRREEYEY